jgi:hypothetical protein
MNADGYIYIGRQDRFALTNGFTIEAWILPDAHKEPMRIISADNGEHSMSFFRNERVGWSMAYACYPDKTFHNSAPSLVFTSYGARDVVFDHMPAPSAEWMHVVMVVGRNNGVQLYLNGQDKKTFDLAAPVTAGNAWLSIGATSSREHLWRGQLAHLAVYSHELNLEQIENHCRQARAKQSSSDSSSKSEEQPME